MTQPFRSQYRLRVDDFRVYYDVDVSQRTVHLLCVPFKGTGRADAVHDLSGQIAANKGDHDTAVAQLTEAAKIEDALPYMEPPYAYMPMRHGLGAALLAAGKPADAEQVYREDLKRNPNNGWSLFGLAQSLRAQGKADAADAVQRVIIYLTNPARCPTIRA